MNSLKEKMEQIAEENGLLIGEEVVVKMEDVDPYIIESPHLEEDPETSEEEFLRMFEEGIKGMEGRELYWRRLPEVRENQSVFARFLIK